jgi:hypothetical protein
MLKTPNSSFRTDSPNRPPDAGGSFGVAIEEEIVTLRDTP